jgi:outer membrane protein assembly factor BamA
MKPRVFLVIVKTKEGKKRGKKMPENATVKALGRRDLYWGKRNPHGMLHKVCKSMVFSVIISVFAASGGTLRAMAATGMAPAGRNGLITVDQIKIVAGFTVDTRVIHGFLGEIEEGASFPPEVLAKLLTRAEERLVNTNWFDRAAIYAVPRKDRPDLVKIIIELEEGFPCRFWGGPNYAGAGWENIKGSGKSIGLELGYKHYYLSYTGYYWGPSGLFYQIGLGSRYFTYTRPNGMRTGAQKKGGSVFLGYKSKPDLMAGIVAEAFLLSRPGSGNTGIFQIGGRLLLDERNNTFFPTAGRYGEAYAGYRACIPQGAALDAYGYMVRAERRSYFALSQDFLAVLRLQGVVQPDVTIDDALRYSLHGFNGIRAPFKEAMVAPVLLQAGGELRYRLLESDLFGFVNLSVEPAVFIDLGLAGGDAAEIITSPAFLAAAGLALRLRFGAPVFFLLRLEAGWNQEGGAEVFFGIQETL